MFSTRFLALLGGLFAASFAHADHPLAGEWYVTAFEQETTANPRPVFDFTPTNFKLITFTETTPGTLVIELRNAAGRLLETETRTFVREGDFFESVESTPDDGGRERIRLGLQMIRHDLVLAHDIGGWFNAEDSAIFDGWSFAGVLTREPLPKPNPSLWMGNFDGREWLYSDDWNGTTRFFIRETGTIDLLMEKVGSAFRASATLELDGGETDVITFKPSGTLLALDENLAPGEIFWDDAFSRGTSVLDRSRYRILQVSDTELVLLGVEGSVARVTPKGDSNFTPYNQIDVVGSSLAYFTNVDPVYYQGQTISLESLSASSVPYTASGLPAGLILNRTSGAVTGQVTANPGAYAITRRAGTTNANTTYVRVREFPRSLAAHPNANSIAPVYAEHEALLENPLTDEPIGKVTLKLAAGGLFTGTLATNAPNTIPLKGRFAPSSDGSSASVTLDIPGSRTLSLSLDSEGLLDAVLNSGITTLGEAQAGDRSGRISLHYSFAPAPGAASRGTVAYTLALAPDVESPESAPRGHGWATATLATSGLLTLKGTLADGRPLTGSLRATSAGYLPYLRPYGPLSLGYLAGRLAVVERQFGGHHITPETGRLIWSKPSKVAASDRIPGFGPLSLGVTMEPWTRVVTADDFLLGTGLSVAEPLTVTLSGGIPASETPRALPSLLNYTVTNGRFSTSVFRPVLDTLSASKNTAAWAKVWTLTVNLTNGTFTGSFTLTDTVPPATRAVSRKVPFSGVILGNQQDRPFVGHYIVPNLDKAQDSQTGAITLGYDAF